MRKEICAVIRRVLPTLRQKGNLFFAEPIGDVLRGVNVEKSSDMSAFYIWKFVQPLYVPAESVVLSYGSRIGGNSKRWRAIDGALLDHAIRASEIDEELQCATAGEFVEFLRRRKICGVKADIAAAFSLVVARRIGDATEKLRSLIDTLQDAKGWMAEWRDKCQCLLEVVATPQADVILAKWRSETLRAIGIER